MKRIRNVLKNWRTSAAGWLFVGGAMVTAIAAASAPDAAMLRKIEEVLKLPPGAAPLGSYNRYYAYAKRNGRTLLVGIFLDSGTFPSEANQPASSHPVESEAELPRVFDGGCSVLNVIVDPLSPQDARIHCNGVA